MVIQLDPRTEVLSLVSQLDKLIVEGCERADDPLRRISGDWEDDRFYLKTSAFYQTLCRLMAALSTQAAHCVEAAKRYQACRAVVVSAGAPLDDNAWTVDHLTLDYHVRRYLPEVVVNLVQLRREALPLLTEALVLGPSSPANVLGFVRLVVRDEQLAAC